jgi:hypothetical protein
MSDIYSPFVSHDPYLDYGRGMTDCEMCGISGWCGPKCPAYKSTTECPGDDEL